MVQKKYTALIIGCGNMGVLNDAPGSGNEHKTISYAKALKENGNFEVFLHDKDENKMLTASDIWKMSWVKEIEERNYDVVIIATPDERHHIDLVNVKELRRPKLVICEKPLCNDVVVATAIVQMYEEFNVPILLDYTRRFIPELQELKKRYDAGIFGKLITANYTFNRGMLHTGTHAIDFHNWFFGDGNGKILEVEDCDYRIWSIDLFFEKFHWSERRIGDVPVPSYYDHHTKHVIDNAYNFLEDKEELKCTMYDGLKALEIMEGLCK